MGRCHRTIYDLATLGSAIIALACETALAQVSGSASGISVPFYYEAHEMLPGQTNRLKMLVIGRDVEMQPGSTLLVKQMRLEHYGTDGKTNLIARSPECLLDQPRKAASSASYLEMETENGIFFLTGKGYTCYFTNLSLTLSNSVETLIREDIARNLRGRKSSLTSLVKTNVATNTVTATNYIKIVSDHLVFIHASNTVTYSHNVRVDSSQFEMACQQLDGRRSTNGSLESIVAQRDVVFFNKADRSSATGDRAVYLVQEGRETVLLSGNDARWQDTLREARAARFHFDLKDQQLRAEEKAYFKLPRASIGSQSLLPGQSPARTNAPPGDLEINAELLAVQLPTTNNPSRSVTASSNVVITSATDRNRATADEAKYSEATGILELIGRAVWQSGDRLVSGDTLFVDRTNRLFAVTSNAFLRLPLAELGKQALLSPLAAGGTNNPAGSNAPQFIELWCNDFDYRGNALTFRHKIRAHFLEGTNALGSLHCGLLQFLFNSNQVERVTAKDAVHIEQFPYTSTNGATITKSLDCELINVLLATNGWITRIIAETNVSALQVERSKTNAAPVASMLTAQLVIGEFFTHTNRLRELVALKEVTLAHDQHKAWGERAVYNVTNNLIELTGHPRAQLPPQGEITGAEVLTYDVARKTFSVQKGTARGERQGRDAGPPASGTNQSNLPFIK